MSKQYESGNRAVNSPSEKGGFAIETFGNDSDFCSTFRYGIFGRFVTGPRRPYKGFTLIELMIVVAIIGILAAVAIPKFADLIRKARESSAKNALGSLRSALNIYYTDQTFFPGNLEIALVSGNKYFQEIPVIDIPAVPLHNNPGHSNATGVKNISSPDDDVAGGVFAYDNAFDRGLIYINCTHNDAKGVIWSAY